jgi:hypothetical protein
MAAAFASAAGLGTSTEIAVKALRHGPETWAVLAVVDPKAASLQLHDLGMVEEAVEQDSDGDVVAEHGSEVGLRIDLQFDEGFGPSGFASQPGGVPSGRSHPDP